MERLADKRVAMSVPAQLVRAASRKGVSALCLPADTVFVDVRDQADRSGMVRCYATPGWQQRWLENFTNRPGVPAKIWCRMAGQIVTHPSAHRESASRRTHAHEHVVGLGRRRLRKDGGSASAQRPLSRITNGRRAKAWYASSARAHDAYLQAFNEPATRLLDTTAGASRRSRPGNRGSGRRVRGGLHVASIQVGTLLQDRAGFDPAGRGAAVRILARGHAHAAAYMSGYPNMPIVQPTRCESDFQCSP